MKAELTRKGIAYAQFVGKLIDNLVAIFGSLRKRLGVSFEAPAVGPA